MSVLAGLLMLLVAFGGGLILLLLLVGLVAFLIWCHAQDMLHFDVRHPLQSFARFSRKALKGPFKVYYVFLLINVVAVLGACALDLLDPYYCYEQTDVELSESQALEEMPGLALTEDDQAFLKALYDHALEQGSFESDPESVEMTYEAGSEESLRLISDFSSRPSDLCKIELVYIEGFTDGKEWELLLTASFYDSEGYDSNASEDEPTAVLKMETVKYWDDVALSKDNVGHDGKLIMLSKQMYEYGERFDSSKDYIGYGSWPHGIAWDCYSCVREGGAPLAYGVESQGLKRCWFYRPQELYFYFLMHLPD